MKKFLVLAIMAIFIGIIVPSKVHAVDIAIGATTWYTWWDYKMIDGGTTKAIDLDPAFLYGPALSVKFSDDFNLTFIYLYGKFDEKSYALKFKRNDSDLALNYKLNDYFKLFAGVKYMNFAFREGDNNYDHSSLGPGLGLSATFPVLENLFILANISGMYLWGYKEISEGKKDIKEYGINSTLSIGYYIAPASTVISLGGRFQYYKTDYDVYADLYEKHKFYGITLTATYNFSI